MKKLSEIMARREFLLSGGLLGAGTAVAVGVIVKDRLPSEPQDPTGQATVRNLNVLKNLKPSDSEDNNVRMQRELVKAMAKPVEKRHWIMVIDIRKCVGCYACTIGCVAENKLPPGVVYRPVTTEETGEYPNLRIKFTPRPCMQCDNPSCVPVCPVKATWKRPDGIVVIDYDRCIGCRYCLTCARMGPERQISVDTILQKPLSALRTERIVPSMALLPRTGNRSPATNTPRTGIEIRKDRR